MPRLIYRQLMAQCLSPSPANSNSQSPSAGELGGAECTLEDLRELQPDLARGLDQIINCKDVAEFDTVRLTVIS